MDIIQSLFLGVVQGVTEFLPISSSGHLVLTPWIFDWKDHGLAFDVALHFGTLLAVVAFFWKDWIDIFAAALTGKKKGDFNRKYLWILVLATIPGVAAGFFLNDLAESFFRSPLVVAFTLSFFGLALFLADKFFKKKKHFGKISFKEGLMIGLAQAVAIVPGTSRSGITMTVGLMLGLTRKSAAKFSFLMATPIIFGASVYKAGDFINKGISFVDIIGIFAAFISGYVAIAGMLKFIEKVGYHWFFYYRFLLAALIVLLVFLN